MGGERVMTRGVCLQVQGSAFWRIIHLCAQIRSVYRWVDTSGLEVGLSKQSHVVLCESSGGEKQSQHLRGRQNKNKTHINMVEHMWRQCGRGCRYCMGTSGRWGKQREAWKHEQGVIYGGQSLKRSSHLKGPTERRMTHYISCQLLLFRVTSRLTSPVRVLKTSWWYWSYNGLCCLEWWSESDYSGMTSCRDGSVCFRVSSLIKGWKVILCILYILKAAHFRRESKKQMINT